MDSQGRAIVNVILTAGDQPVSTLQFDIQYQGEALGVSVSPGVAAASAGKALWTSNLQSGVTRILIAGANATSISEGVVATLAIQATAGTSPALFPLVVANVMAADASGYFVAMRSSDGNAVVPGPTLVTAANAASYTTGTVAPGEVVVIWGNTLAAPAINTLQLASDGGALAKSLAGTRVLFDGVPAPLVYTTPDQVSVVVPYEISGHSQTSLQAEYLGTQSAPLVLAVAQSSPAIFTANQSGSGQGAIVNEDGTVNGPQNPAPGGSVVAVYGTGGGQTVPAGADGAIAEPSNLPQPILPVTASIGSQSAEVVYAGAAPGQVSGVLQVNLRIPLSISPGAAVPLTIAIGGSSQPGVTLAVK